MNITQDVITDLLPVYFSGEASGDTRALVDTFFHDHPDFEKLARRSVKVQLPDPVAPANGEKEILRRVQRRLRRRASLLGFAIALTLAPFSFGAITFGHGETHLTWFMPRDFPSLAIAFATAAVLVWTIYLWRRLMK